MAEDGYDETLLMPWRRFQVLEIRGGWAVYDSHKDGWEAEGPYWLWVEADDLRRKAEVREESRPDSTAEPIEGEVIDPTAPLVDSKGRVRLSTADQEVLYGEVHSTGRPLPEGEDG